MADAPIRYVVFSTSTPGDKVFYIVIFYSIYGLSAETAVGGFSLDLHFAYLLEIRFAYTHQNSPTIPVLNAATITATISPHSSQYIFLFFVARVMSHFQNLYLQSLCSSIENPLC